jgi:hypothetical protein
MHRWVVGPALSTAPDATCATTIQSQQFRHDTPSRCRADLPSCPVSVYRFGSPHSGREKFRTAKLTVKMDPRVKITAAALQKKFEMETRLASLLSETSQAGTRAGSIREPLQKLSQQASGAARTSIESFQNKLIAVLGAPATSPAPLSDEITLARVNRDVAALYGQVWQVDAEPTAAQAEAVAAIERKVSDVMKRWNALLVMDLPALNRALHEANLPEVHLESHPPSA